MRLGKALSMVLVIGLAAAQAQRAEKRTGEKSMENSAPLACRIGALDATQRARHKQLREEIRAGLQAVRELPDGYEFQLPAETEVIKLAAEFITLERLCCPFFKFALEIGEEGKPLSLKLTGREGVKQFMQVELGLK